MLHLHCRISTSVRWYDKAHDFCRQKEDSGDKSCERAQRSHLWNMDGTQQHCATVHCLSHQQSGGLRDLSLDLRYRFRTFLQRMARLWLGEMGPGSSIASRRQYPHHGLDAVAMELLCQLEDVAPVMRFLHPFVFAPGERDLLQRDISYAIEDRTRSDYEAQSACQICRRLQRIHSSNSLLAVVSMTPVYQRSPLLGRISRPWLARRCNRSDDPNHLPSHPSQGPSLTCPA